MSHTPFTTRLLGVAACGLLAVGLSACESDNVAQNADLIAGKKAFAQKCASCHVLARADAKGVQGPNLDDSFRQALRDGFGRNTIHGVVADQIEHPAKVPKDHPAYMPADLVTGRAVSDVAAYVASVAARPGKDTGKLATAVPAAGSGKPIPAKNGKLEIPADPNGQLAYLSKQATAPAGSLEVLSPNKASIPHDIALEGGGVSKKGATVQDGGVSKFTVTLKAGKYAYYCTVAGHREGGMEGTLTVK
ncbi:MAG: Copper binding protein, plastocyanin/azurin family [uncultured Solirubrobacteraceae bacterium]|uniref:Copper binding protein, plastocyanin/azurin family n=1 Tax=uncultured Solirubrobacteraceae bacterium TaxID=1162706 RepID=A0A6J4S9D1_9ACTN|nr:MAG: Copper binding protein, plastocyanin/azurin family [uncultured Solirubrobacteraceae bacterium]